MGIGKRGISDLIATVLMIMLTVSAVVILATVFISFVKNSLDDSKTDCLTSVDKIKIVPEGSCYNSSFTKVQVRFGNINITDIYFVFDTGTGSDVIEQPLTNIVPGMEKTFPFPAFNSSKAEIGIIINNKKCSISDSIELRRC